MMKFQLCKVHQKEKHLQTTVEWYTALLFQQNHKFVTQTYFDT